MLCAEQWPLWQQTVTKRLHDDWEQHYILVWLQKGIQSLLKIFEAYALTLNKKSHNNLNLITKQQILQPTWTTAFSSLCLPDTVSLHFDHQAWGISRGLHAAGLPYIFIVLIGGLNLIFTYGWWLIILPKAHSVPDFLKTLKTFIHTNSQTTV